MKRYILILLVILAVGCATPPKEPMPNDTSDVTLEVGDYKDVRFDPDKELQALSFNSVEEYQDFLDSGSQPNYYARQAFDVPMIESDMMAEGAVATKQVSGGSRDYSETNVQVAGVDEADIIKTDGEYIYTLSDDTLYILLAYPGEDAEIISTVGFESTPTSIFIDGDKLAVFGNFNDLDYFKDIGLTPRHGMTFFDIYDISDKEDPKLEEELKFEGNYFDARMNDGDVYFVVRNNPEYRPVYPTPVIVRGDDVKSMPVSDVHYFNIPYDNAQLVSVHAIGLDDAEVNSESFTVEYGQNLYMSENNIYITYTETISEYELGQQIMMDLLEDELTEEDDELIEKIKKTDNDVLSNSEKKQKIRAIYMSYFNYMDPDKQDEIRDEMEKELEELMDEYEYLEYTIINRIAAQDGEVRLEANGKVPGHVINQFSMDEKDDVFRIATTVSSRWSKNERTDSTNNIYTLDLGLEELDSLEGLAEDESIYSTRFMGDMLYMVTFKQIDPFFVIDLSDPEDIEQLGELKIPGFSRYLHPYDEDTIIGIGQDATETGRAKGLKISLFDVSDYEDPQEVETFILEERYSSSNVLYEHKAFLFDREKNLMVIPAYNRGYSDDPSYNGAFVFDISKDEIELRGLIDHSGQGTSWHSPSVERSLFIEDYLYTKSPDLLRINHLDDLHSVKNITLEKGGKYPTY